MKTNLFMVAAVALMAMVSCNKMEEYSSIEKQKPSYIVEFTAEAANENLISLAQVQTKTTYDVAAKKTLWENNDAISVNGEKFTTTELADGGLSARFVNSEELGAFTSPYMAVYPYAQSYTFSGASVKGISVSSTPTMDTKGANIAVAYNASGNTLSFKNVTSMIRFSVDMDGVTEVEISSNNGTAIAGTIDVDWNNGVPSVKSITNGSSSIVVKGKFVKGTKYYVNVLPQTLATGITIRLNGIIAKTKKTSITLGRSKVMISEGLKLTESGLTITGNFTDNGLSSWNPAGGIKMYKEDSSNLYVAKNVSMMQIPNGETSVQFKITNGTWDKAYDAENYEVGKWKSVRTSQYNTYAPKGEYDIYYDTKMNKMLMTPVGSRALTIYLSYDNRSHLWYWSEKSEIASVTGIDWPGVEGDMETIDNWRYYKWLVVIPGSNVGQKMKFIFSSDNGNNKLETPAWVNMQDVMFYDGSNAAFLK